MSTLMLAFDGLMKQNEMMQRFYDLERLCEKVIIFHGGLFSIQLLAYPSRLFNVINLNIYFYRIVIK